MGFTVTRAGGTKDAEFQAYVRLLRQSGYDLGKLPRVPEPGTKRRWVFVWPTAEAAQEFAEELKVRTGDSAWQVEPVAAPPSVGPFGPILIQLARQADGLLFAPHPLSLAMIRSAFPQAKQKAASAFVNTQAWYDFLKTRGDLGELVKEIGPELTGLPLEEMKEIGYAVLDADTDETLVFVKPAQIAQDGFGSPDAGGP
jgi:hypothetical protein